MYEFYLFGRWSLSDIKSQYSSFVHQCISNYSAVFHLPDFLTHVSFGIRDKRIIFYLLSGSNGKKIWQDLLNTFIPFVLNARTHISSVITNLNWSKRIASSFQEYNPNSRICRTFSTLNHLKILNPNFPIFVINVDLFVCVTCIVLSR